ncbi:hypothetical protein EV197_2537 [Aquimarina brevivitae]|uniref:Uncharacterized protein n=2 Tax=Aquimarina brevivitae TaxID=323412 RepID=A0A4Q7P248_9FLAO|nr:hypothetical protein EV197_2537 [Aquimarina brevivitae]
MLLVACNNDTKSNKRKTIDSRTLHDRNIKASKVNSQTILEIDSLNKDSIQLINKLVKVFKFRANRDRKERERIYDSLLKNFQKDSFKITIKPDDSLLYAKVDSILMSKRLQEEYIE